MALDAAVQHIRQHTDAHPEIGLILGSGLGVLAEAAEDPVIVETAGVPGYPTSTVSGHHGRLVFGTLEGRSVVFVQGRAHRYEGHGMEAVTMPVRLLHALGVERLLVTNAAGGINPRFVPGTLMLLTDHLNWTHTAPPLAVTGWAAQARPAPSPYDPVWRAQVQELALAEGIAVEQGSYVWVLGPSYETKAEIRAFARLGADAVGMSTVPEVLMAHRLGMRVLALSTITNPAAGLSPVPLSHDEVLEVGQQVRTTLERLIRGIVYSARSC